jgi:hypothetical protein
MAGPSCTPRQSAEGVAREKYTHSKDHGTTPYKVSSGYHCSRLALPGMQRPVADPWPQVKMHRRLVAIEQDGRAAGQLAQQFDRGQVAELTGVGGGDVAPALAPADGAPGDTRPDRSGRRGSRGWPGH